MNICNRLQVRKFRGYISNGELRTSERLAKDNPLRPQRLCGELQNLIVCKIAEYGITDPDKFFVTFKCNFRQYIMAEKAGI